MDITKFFTKSENNVQQTPKQIMKAHFGTMLENKIITMSEYEYCMEYIDNEMTLKNGQKFDTIALKCPKCNQVNEIINLHNIERLVLQMKMERENIIYFTDERMTAIRQIFETLYQNKLSIYGIYGYAGTGKTTLMIEIVQFLLVHGLIKSVIFSAPTHKALNVMKTNFNKIIHNLVKNLGINDRGILDDNLMELLSHNIQIEFDTIHKLLGYSIEFTTNGDKIFTKSKQKAKTKHALTNYDLIIIDECSMIPLYMISELFSNIRNHRIHNENNMPKIIFTGDPAQLPPVNEKSSSIFIRTKNDITYSDYVNAMTYEHSSLITPLTTKNDYNKLIDEIMTMQTITLKQIFRNTHTNVLGICNELRTWVIDENTTPKLGIYAGNGVSLYKCKTSSKIDTPWFRKCIELFREGIQSNIILTWTNKSSDKYNNAMRQILLNKKNVGTFEIGDVLLLNDFYCFDDFNNGKTTINDDENRFYTSEQIKIVNLCVTTLNINKLEPNISSRIHTLSASPDIIKKFNTTVRKINNDTQHIFTVWKLTVIRLMDNNCIANHDNKEYIMHVIHEKSFDELENNNQMIMSIIRKLANSYTASHSDHMKTIDKYILKPLWKYFNKNFVSQFANVIFGYSITTHKAQGSTFNNVFVDASDILQNDNLSESKRCIYTSHTRCANELHIII